MYLATSCDDIFLTSRHNDLISRHNGLISRHNYLTSDGRNMPPYYTNEIFSRKQSVMINCKLKHVTKR